jgi:hypothetical protein
MPRRTAAKSTIDEDAPRYKVRGQMDWGGVRALAVVGALVRARGGHPS